MTYVEIAETLFQAFADGDDETVKSLCSPNFRAIQNGGDPMELATVLAFSSAVKSVVTSFRYENPIRSATATGFVEEHDVCGALPDGISVRLSICVVADIIDGKIVQLREYFDTTAAAGVSTHLGAS